MRRALVVGALALAALGSGASVAEASAPAAAPPATSTTAATPDAAALATRCSNTVAPAWFTKDAKAVAKAYAKIPDAWGGQHDFARIVCFESSYRTSAVNGSYHGLGQMSSTSVKVTAVSWNSYLHGTSAHPVSWYQIEAALLYAKSRYGSPAAGWAHEVNYGWW